MNPATSFSPYQVLLWVGASGPRIVAALALLAVVAVCAPVGAVVLGCAARRRIRCASAWVLAWAGSWVSLLAWQWSTRPVRHCACCRPTEAQFQTRAEVFGPLGEFGPYQMPRREPQHVPPQALPSPWLDPYEVLGETAGDGFAWFGVADEPEPLSLDEWLEQCRAEYESKRESGGDL